MIRIFSVFLNDGRVPAVWTSDPIPDEYKPLAENMASMARGYLAGLKAASDEEMRRAWTKRRDELLKEVYSYDDPFCPDVRVRLEEIAFLKDKIETS